MARAKAFGRASTGKDDESVWSLEPQPFWSEALAFRPGPAEVSAG